MSTTPEPYTTPIPVNASISRRVVDILADLGGIPAERLPAGTDGIAELTAAHGQGRMCELVEGYLVERAMGYRESLIAAVIIEFLNSFVRKGRLGVVSGADGFFQLSQSSVRGPDVAFVS